MIMKTYPCFKQCGFVGNSLGEILNHYKAEPTHRRTFGKTKKQKRIIKAEPFGDLPKVDVQISDTEEKRSQVRGLLITMKSEIGKWEREIEFLQRQVGKMWQTYEVLSAYYPK